MNYYNEFDPNAAEWLRELIKQGLIPDGEVDTRSIKDVRANDLTGFRQCHFFAGIGGWSLALQLAGWPADKAVWTGSCPCQAFSTAGKQEGFKDDRDLWPVFFQLIAECQPEYVFGEQVENAIRHGWLDRVYADLERENYTVGAVVLGAHSVGAPHIRQRLYWGGAFNCSVSNTRLLRSTIGKQQATGNVEHSCVGWLADDQCVRFIQSQHERQPRHEQGISSGGVQHVGMDDLQGVGRRIHQPSNIGQTSGEINSLANTGVISERLSDTESERSQGHAGDVPGGNKSGRFETEQNGHAGNFDISSLSPWTDFDPIYCRDEKMRRVPAESVFFGVADGLPEELDGGGTDSLDESESGFPLTQKTDGRVMLLKGYGNAIVPQVAAAFVGAFTNKIEEIKR